MKTLACKDFDMACDYVAKGMDDKEVIQKASMHVKTAHPDKWNDIKNLNMEDKEALMMPKIMDV